MDVPMPAVPGVEHRQVATARIEVHVAEAGAGEPLVLLHGWPQHWFAWRRLIPKLADQYRVICPDLRGLGWSEAPSSGYWKEDLADDLLALLDSLDLTSVRVIGHDWGTFVAYLAAIRRPQRIRRLLALNDIHPWIRVDPRDAVNIRRLWYQVVLSTPGLGTRRLRQGPGFVRGLIRRWSAVDIWSDEELEAFERPLREPSRARASALYYRTFFFAELPRLLAGRYRHARLSVPTLQLFGEDDGVIRPYQLKGFERHADAMSLELVPGIGHFIAEEAPDLVAERALGFFARADS
jgi:pimeloyl-ACP methyl ester carboxylesterase